MIVTLALRITQIIFAAIVLGLSIKLIKDQIVGSTPPTTGYSAFTGGFGALTALIGIAAIFIDGLGGLIMAAIDGLASIIFLAGGIAMVVGLKGVSCSSNSDLNEYHLQQNKLINGGCLSKKGQRACAYWGFPDKERSRCKTLSADAAFMFLGFAVCLGGAVVSIIAMRRGTGRKGVVV